jgi:hypothetical protein
MQKERQNLHSGKHNSFAFPVVQACTSHRVAFAHPRRGSTHRSRSCRRTVRRVAACLTPVWLSRSRARGVVVVSASTQSDARLAIEVAPRRAAAVGVSTGSAAHLGVEAAGARFDTTRA